LDITDNYKNNTLGRVFKKHPIAAGSFSSMPRFEA